MPMGSLSPLYLKHVFLVPFLLFLHMGTKKEDKKYEIATWYQFKDAAVSYTFDDNCKNQLDVALPLFDRHRFKATFFTVTNWAPHWPLLRAASLNGHEVASHSMSHPNLPSLSYEDQEAELKKSRQVIDSMIPDAHCTTIAYPFCSKSATNLTARYYIGARTCQGVVEPKTPKDFYGISSIVLGTKGAFQKAAELNEKVEEARTQKGWCTFLLHGIDDDGGYSPFSSQELDIHLSYLRTHAGSFWVAPFGDVLKYIKERDALSLVERNISPDSLQLEVTDSLDNAVFHVPITLRRTLPEGWQTPSVFVKGKPILFAVVMEKGSSFLQFDVVPDQGPFLLCNCKK